jgi:long-subunit acyl-CoA synthetase (AMP-forming)
VTLFVAKGRLTKKLVEELYARTGIPVKQGYGLTEWPPLSSD